MRTRIPPVNKETPRHVRRRRRSSRDDEFTIHPIRQETNQSRSREEWTKHEQNRIILPKTITMAGETVQRLQQQVGNNATKQVIAGAEGAQRQGGTDTVSPEVIRERLADFLDNRLTDWHAAMNTALDDYISDHWAAIQNNPPSFASRLTTIIFAIIPQFWGVGKVLEVASEITAAILDEVSSDNQERLESSESQQQRMRLEQFREIMRQRFEKIVEEFKNKRREIILAMWPEIERRYWFLIEIANDMDELEVEFLRLVFDDEFINGSSINSSRVREHTNEELEKEWEKMQEQDRSNRLQQEIFHPEQIALEWLTSR